MAENLPETLPTWPAYTKAIVEISELIEAVEARGNPLEIMDVRGVRAQLAALRSRYAETKR